MDESQDRKMEVIQDLMEELQGLMGPSAEDFESRLGRSKPSVEIMKLDAKDPMDGDDAAMDGGLDEDPEDKFKSRLMKLRA